MNSENFIEEQSVSARAARRAKRAQQVEIAMAALDGAAAVDPNAERQQEHGMV